MISLKDAKEIIFKKYEGFSLNRCLDYGEFFVFFLIPSERKKGTYQVGTIFPAVRKKDGKFFQYDITSNPEAYMKAKRI